jgi:hypothetical protein
MLNVVQFNGKKDKGIEMTQSQNEKKKVYEQIRVVSLSLFLLL